MYQRFVVNHALTHSSIQSISPSVTYIYVCECLLFLLFLTFSHISPFPLHILFLCRAYSCTPKGLLLHFVCTQMLVYIHCWGKRLIYYICFVTKLKVCSFLNRLMQYYDGKVWGVIIGLWWGDKEYTECKAGPGLWKTLHNTPPVRSSQFPGPGVYVSGAITHQVPWLPLSAFCVLWHSPLPYSCCLRSFPLLWLD